MVDKYKEVLCSDQVEAEAELSRTMRGGGRWTSGRREKIGGPPPHTNADDEDGGRQTGSLGRHCNLVRQVNLKTKKNKNKN
jgi:hypothetical protein